MKDYIIRAALHEETNQGWVWMDGIASRTVVKITNPERKRSIFCQVREFDKNFLREYNAQKCTFNIKEKFCGGQPTIVMGGWYRDALGIRKTTEEDDITDRQKLCVKRFGLWGWRDLRATAHHPDIVVRLSLRLALLGVWLGAVGLMLSLRQLCLNLSPLLASLLIAPIIILSLAACRAPKKPLPKKQNG